jgi:hypothetical protein
VTEFRAFVLALEILVQNGSDNPASSNFPTYIHNIQGDQKVSVQMMITMPHHLAQSDCLAADRQGQRDTRHTLKPSVIPNSNYVIMVIATI